VNTEIREHTHAYLAADFAQSCRRNPGESCILDIFRGTINLDTNVMSSAKEK
jgi:hypothetical protein